MLTKLQLVLLVVILVTGVTASKQDAVTLVNGGYEGIIVGIGPDVVEHPRLLKRLQEYLTDASARLFTATKRQTFFRNITIVVPSSWKTSTSANDKGATLDEAIIKIDKENKLHGKIPYTLQAGGCGKPGEYIHLTPHYVVIGNAALGEPGKVLVHEWGHLRWGLFDEYPTSDEEQFYISSEEKKIVATKCSDDIIGEIKGDCEWDGNVITGKCTFKANDKQETGSASIMFGQNLDGVDAFCDEGTHNQEASNKQNRICNLRSAWEVMKDHDDFKNGDNTLGSTTDTRPTFRIVKEIRIKNTVLVLDKSGSMRGEPLSLLRTAAKNYISQFAKNETMISIVQFDSSPRVNIGPTLVETERSKLIKALPDTTGGGTNIQKGIERAVKVINDSGHCADGGGKLVVITDGKDFNNYTDKTKQILKSCHLRVDAIAIGINADAKLEKLASEHNGRSCYFITGQPVNILSQCLKDTGGTNSVDIQTSDQQTFVIDGSIGLGTTLIISHKLPLSSVNLTDPRNFSHTENSSILIFERDPDFGQTIVKIKGQAQIGTWKYSIMSTSNESVSLSISSSASNQSVGAITAEASVNSYQVDYSGKSHLKITAFVKQGYTPIKRAKVSVVITRPNAADYPISLRDDGTGYDVQKDDGIYTGTYVAKNFNGNGRYGISLFANGHKRTRIFYRSNAGGAATNGEIPVLTTKPTGVFNRYASVGAFVVQNYKRNVNDLIEPGKVRDFALEGVDVQKKIVTFSFTSTGDDIDQGNVARHEILYYNSMEDYKLRSNNPSLVPEARVLSGNINSETEPGKSMIVKIDCETMQSNSSYIFSVRGVDAASNKGDHSNPVIVILRQLDLKGYKQPPPKPNAEKITLIIFATLGSLILISVIVGGIFSCCRREFSKKGVFACTI
ncbi:calcium-activated chloride channel regulator 3A-1-like [Tubulanus polymorphus]|uniref:calcium-activated chloride channel regulator 3A-1-like n=1 Tax=Tubulanus polymorphus TaxID=672921 RepID=UPI003DA55619